jgi:putative ATPase
MDPEDQSELFSEAGPDAPAPAQGDAGRPLAVRMRPRSLSEVVGQQHILGPGSLLKRLVAQNNFGSLLFYGPPGTGKTASPRPSPGRRAAGLSV